MPAPAPDTLFYSENQANTTLWRDVSRLYEDFVGDDEGRVSQFETVLRDVLVKLHEAKETEVAHAR